MNEIRDYIAEFDLEEEKKKSCPGSKIRSKGKGRGLGIGQGKGPIGRMGFKEIEKPKVKPRKTKKGIAI